MLFDRQRSGAERSASMAESRSEQTSDDGVGKVASLTVLVLAGGLVVTLLGGRAGHCMGATRTMRLKFEARQLEAKELQERGLRPRTDAPGTTEEERRLP